MNKNELEGTEIKRTAASETEKLRDLANAPVKAETMAGRKEKLAEARDSIAQRLDRQKEVKTADAERPEKPEKADLEEELNKGSDSPSFGTSQGTCRRSQTPQNYCILAGF